ncbi:MAG: hypothetical protein HOE54_06320, partial [Gammaproteobacteria bacterium]|nr:hypothetical protein [Gammaproteobacteria bacterium]
MRYLPRVLLLNLLAIMLMGAPTLFAEDKLSDLQRIDAAWQNYVRELTRSGDLIRDQAFSNSVINRFEGYRSVMAIAAVNYANLLFPDRNTPEYIPDFGPLVNYCAPAPSYKYGMFHLDPAGTYRVRGFRGDAELIDFQQQAGWYGENEGENQIITKVNITFDKIDTGVGKDGYYDFILSNKEQSGRWWKLEEDVNALFIREFYVDFDTHPRSATFHIDRIDAPEKKTTSVSEVDEAVFRLEAMARAQDYLNLCLRMGNAFPEGDNMVREERYDQGGGQIDQRYFQARYNVKQDEALILEWPVPKACRFWSFALYNDYWQVLNYGNRQTHLNSGMVDLDENRLATMVISHRDPGYQNWIDVDGHDTGILLARAKICGKATVPRMRKVSFNNLHSEL